MTAGRFLQAGGTEGRPADLAHSTDEGVGGLAVHLCGHGVSFDSFTHILMFLLLFGVGKRFDWIHSTFQDA